MRINKQLYLEGTHEVLARFARSLKLSAECQFKAIDIIDQAQTMGLTSGRNPISIAAAALYISALMHGEKRTQNEVADVAGITEITLRNNYKRLVVTI
jgi:transcription initiation factor TFIIB